MSVHHSRIVRLELPASRGAEPEFARMPRIISDFPRVISDFAAPSCLRESKFLKAPKPRAAAWIDETPARMKRQTLDRVAAASLEAFYLVLMIPFIWWICFLTQFSG